MPSCNHSSHFTCYFRKINKYLEIIFRPRHITSWWSGDVCGIFKYDLLDRSHFLDFISTIKQCLVPPPNQANISRSPALTVTYIVAVASPSGVYSCKPDNAQNINITLHVLKGRFFVCFSRSFYTCFLPRPSSPHLSKT